MSARHYGKSVSHCYDSSWSYGIFTFATESRPALGPIQPTLLWVQEALSPG